MTRDAQQLDVPGARLHYEVRGAGPVLLIIPGGPSDADGFAGLADALASGYTVVTYDPRGISRSTRDDPAEDILIETQADDAYRLLTAVGAEPAYVLGSSSGSFTGLTLMARHPDRVRTLVVHEPPITELLPERAEQRAEGEELYETYAKEGAGAALAKLLEQAGMSADSDSGGGAGDSGGGLGAAGGGGSGGGPGGPPEGELPAEMARMMDNLDVFFGHMIRPMTGYLPDVEALRAAPTRVVVACGEASVGQVAHRAAIAFAQLIGTDVVTFPGGHEGPGSDPQAFADAVRSALA